jgi:predicted site-specific integrase-resolvase
MAKLKTKQAAERLNLSLKTLENWRYLGKGPAFVRLGKIKGVRYREEDLNAFAAARRVDGGDCRQDADTADSGSGGYL